LPIFNTLPAIWNGWNGKQWNPDIGLAGVVFGHGTALLGSHSDGQLFSREASRLRGQCDNRLGYGT
jgi:hypothetical protein